MVNLQNGEHPMAGTFLELADAIENRNDATELSVDAAFLADALGLSSGDENLQLSNVANLPALLKIAAKVKDFSAIQCLPAPNANLFIAQVDPAGFGFEGKLANRASVAGCSESTLSAFCACMAEAAEYLSQLTRQGDDVEIAGSSAQNNDEFLQATDAQTEVFSYRTGQHETVPSYRIFVTKNTDESRRISSGCAAGRTYDVAFENAVLELIERDAITRWWHEEQTARRISSEIIAQLGTANLVKTLRGNALGRSYALFDIRSTVDIPVIASISFDAHGRNFAGGYSAAMDIRLAMEKAVHEMIQMEMGLIIAKAKEQKYGAENLNQADLRQKLRAVHLSPEHQKLDVESLEVFTERKRSGSQSSVPPTTHFFDVDLAALNIMVKDLTRPDLEVPVAKAFSETLRILPPDSTLTWQDIRQKPTFIIPLF
ncbi:MAG: YcaO-like family protein [Planctomycetaceae bacterium]|nr:YcaO-like family protein [Planctomycetaceae bacterium]